MTLSEQIERTYGSSALAQKLLESLKAAGLDLEQLTTQDLIAFDELHIMGRQATLDLGKYAGLSENMHILDIGSGLGGTARTLAESFGCRVTGIDLSAEYVKAATELSRLVGLGDLVTFRQAEATTLPFGEGRFDTVLMLHLNMNIVDKTALFREALRVLKPGGRLALWEVCSGSGGAVIYPVPWADREDFSHLVPVEVLAEHLRAAGAADLEVTEASKEAAAWVKERLAAMQKPRRRRPTPDLDLVLKDFRAKRANVSKNLLQNRIRVLRAIGSKRG
ncbi:MAG: class I SAM-dependent methyltransferase [Desulfosarcinaceae bacterium]